MSEGSGISMAEAELLPMKQISWDGCSEVIKIRHLIGKGIPMKKWHMIVLFTAHHVLNRRWFGVLFKGRYRAFRIFQTAIVLLMIVSVIASAVSGIVLSQHLYRFFKISKGASIARSVHLVCAYLNYILMSLHL